MIQKELETATLGKTHGLDGFIHVISFSGETGHLEKLSSLVLVSENKERKEVKILEKKKINGKLYFKFSGYENMEAAKTLSKSIVLIPRYAAPPLKNGEFYIADLNGCDLYFNEKKVATVTGSADGAQALLLIVKRIDNKKEYYIPNLPEFISSIDVEGNRIDLKMGELIE